MLKLTDDQVAEAARRVNSAVVEAYLRKYMFNGQEQRKEVNDDEGEGEANVNPTSHGKGDHRAQNAQTQTLGKHPRQWHLFPLTFVIFLVSPLYPLRPN